MFLRFLNRETGVSDLLLSFSRSNDEKTSKAALSALENIPNLEDFRKELEDAVRDLVRKGLSDELKDFVNHYMKTSLEEDVQTENGAHGENRSQIARIKDEKSPWIQGFICYNLCLYIKAFGLDNLKECKVCGKIFAHKGKWATYCSDVCKTKKHQ